MPLAKKGIIHTPEAFVLSTLGFEGFDAFSSGAAAPNTTVQSSLVFPTNVKIPKIVISYTSNTAITAGDAFNIVVGGLQGQTAQAYTQGNVAPNDNSYTASSVQPGTGTGNLGFPTNFATVGQSLFLADIPISAAAAYAYVTPASGLPVATPGFPGYGVQGTGWITSPATTGGIGIFIPTNYDAVFPAGVPLSVRVVSTTSYVNVRVLLCIEPYPLRAGGQQPGATELQYTPGVDL